MNKENLQRMIDHLRTLPQNSFCMGAYRKNNEYSNTECNTIGCIIGHCTVLDSDNIKNNYLYDNGYVKFLDWSYDFTGLDKYLWGFCFHSKWGIVDNTIEGAIKRLELVVNDKVDHKLTSELYSNIELYKHFIKNN